MAGQLWYTLRRFTPPLSEWPVARAECWFHSPRLGDRAKTLPCFSVTRTTNWYTPLFCLVMCVSMARRYRAVGGLRL